MLSQVIPPMPSALSKPAVAAITTFAVITGVQFGLMKYKEETFGDLALDGAWMIPAAIGAIIAVYLTAKK